MGYQRYIMIHVLLAAVLAYVFVSFLQLPCFVRQIIQVVLQ